MIIPQKRKRDSFLPWIQLVVDAFTILVLLQLVFWFRFGTNFFESKLAQPDYPVYQRAFYVVALLQLWLMRTYRLYTPARTYTFSSEMSKVFKAVLSTTLIVMAMTFFIRSFTFSRLFVPLCGVILALGLSFSRYCLGLAVMGIDRIRGSFRNILVINHDDNALKIVHYYKKNPRFSTRVMGFLDDKLHKNSLIAGLPILGKPGELGNVLKTHPHIHEVVLSGQGASNEAVLKMIYECEKSLVAFRCIADMFGLIASKMNVSYLAGVPLLSFNDSPLGDWENRVLKRSMDVILSSTALILLSPVFAALSLLVKMDSSGPVLYGQERVGEDGRRFILYKFRTMKVGAESSSGPVWAKENDPRRTRFGTFLRVNNLDELPQLWNVLIGDMSLVGPRPERPFFVSQFKEDIPRYMARHSIRSGITGWAQVNGLRGNTSIEERTKFDLYYIENWSLWLDIKILFLTLFANKNAY